MYKISGKIMKKKISISDEDYLLTIYKLEKSNRVARSKDIVQMQKVAKSTVTAALKQLSEKNMINYQPYEPITLTPSGVEKAQRLFLRKKAIEDFFINIIQLSKIEAEKVADSIEHFMEPLVLRKFVCFMTFFKKREHQKDSLIKEYKKYVNSSQHKLDCTDCLKDYAKNLDI